MNKIKHAMDTIKKFNVHEMAIFKVCLVLFGLLFGAYNSKKVKRYSLPAFIVFGLTLTYLVVRLFFDDEYDEDYDFDFDYDDDDDDCAEALGCSAEECCTKEDCCDDQCCQDEACCCEEKQTERAEYCVESSICGDERTTETCSETVPCCQEEASALDEIVLDTTQNTEEQVDEGEPQN